MSEELGCSHATCWGWMMWECKNLATTLEDPELNVVKLSAAMDEFDKRLTNLDDVQSSYELSLQDENTILNDIATAADFRDSAGKDRTLATEKFKELSGDFDNKSATHVSSTPVAGGSKWKECEWPHNCRHQSRGSPRKGCEPANRHSISKEQSLII